MTQPDQITDDYRFYLLRKRHAENLILASFRGLRRAGIDPILIKGWAAARNYPEFVPRFFADVDLAVSRSDFEKAKAIIEDDKLGGIDLHCELRHLDSVDWQSLMASSELVDLDGEGIRVLSAEDHLRVLSVHWLTNGGESRDRLWDIVYAVRNRPGEFSWSKCLDVVSSTRRRWIITTLGVAHKYLNLELEGLPFAEEARNLPRWLTRCIEKEWAKKLEIRALESQLKNRGELLRQIMKRIPPNPIHATIDCEGEFDSGSRVGYQLRNMLRRVIPSFRRISTALWKK